MHEFLILHARKGAFAKDDPMISWWPMVAATLLWFHPFVIRLVQSPPAFRPKFRLGEELSPPLFNPAFFVRYLHLQVWRFDRQQLAGPKGV